VVSLRLGDCLEILPTLEAGSVDAVITDPPYGVNFQSCRAAKERRKPKIENDKRPFIWFLYHAYRTTKDGGALLCFCDWKAQDVFRIAIEAAGYAVKSQVIWDRDWHGMGDLRGQFAPQHDVIWFAVKGRFKFPHGRPSSVLRARRLAAKDLAHPTEKPVELMSKLVHAVTRPGDTVLDPFMGAGSTGIACVLEGRGFVGIEKDPRYFEVSRRQIGEAQHLEN
jgi:DNA modification methylase